MWDFLITGHSDVRKFTTKIAKNTNLSQELSRCRGTCAASFVTFVIFMVKFFGSKTSFS